MPIDVRVAEESERESLHDLSQRGFSERPAPFDADRDRAGVPLRRRLVATDNASIVGTLSTWEFGQWYGGRRVPMAGVAGVVVDPVARGRGVASVLLRAAIEAMRAEGEVLSALYPANHTLYRRHGWELAGAFPEHEVTSRALGALPRPARAVHLRAAGEADLDSIMAVYEDVAADEPGQLAPDRVFAAGRMLGVPQKQEAYVAEVDGEIVGSMTLAHAPAADSHEFYALSVRHFVATDHDAELALWGLLASHHPVARSVHFVAPLTATLPHAVGEREFRSPGGTWTWMLRLVDAAGAFAARGFPAWVDAEVHLDVVDDLAPWNAGAHVLRVRDGAGSLEPGGAGRVRVEAGQLAAMYSGWADPHRLARWRLVSGATREDLDALASAFAGPHPWMRYFF